MNGRYLTHNELDLIFGFQTTAGAFRAYSIEAWTQHASWKNKGESCTFYESEGEERLSYLSTHFHYNLLSSSYF